MKSLLLMVTLFVASGAQAQDRVLVLNCIFETNESYVVKTLKSWSNVPAAGIEVANLREGIEKAQAELTSGVAKMSTKPGDTFTVINSPKIVRIDNNGEDFKRVCAILEGEVFQRFKRQ